MARGLGSKLFGLAAIALPLVFAATGEAQTVAAPTVKPAAAAPDATPAAEAHVTGFRSAKFGMDEAEVQAAIAKDFGASGDAVKASTNPAERTRVLTVRVPDVLPDGGAADVAYVFGYKTKKLIQVSLVWSKATDPKMTGERLVGDADVLRANFTGQGFNPDTVVTDTAVRTGLLVFRGMDSAGRSTVLLLEGRTVTEKDQKQFAPLSLLLLYIADAKTPDVFKLAPGQF